MYANDYFTPYLTITAILAVAKENEQQALEYLKEYEIFCDSLPINGEKFEAWHNLGLPMLKGMLAFINNDMATAKQQITKVIARERLLGHSDEQRAIFKKTLDRLYGE